MQYDKIILFHMIVDYDGYRLKISLHVRLPQNGDYENYCLQREMIGWAETELW